MHPVGQGLFYSGVIQIYDRPEAIFKMVFDCGSLNSVPCSNCVRRFRSDYFKHEKNLGLLIISHFNKDHISHLQELIGKDIKIKKLILPFLTFEERLVLVFEIITRNNGTADNEFSVRFIIDPLGTLGDNLDEDSEIFLITKGLDGPPLSDGGSAITESKNSDNLEFNFEYNAKKSISPEDIQIFGAPMYRNSNVCKVEDNRIGYLGGLRFKIKIMDFIFYRRNIGEKENLFYRETGRLFLEKYKIDRTLPEAEFSTKIMDAVLKQRDGRVVKRLFAEVMKGLNLGARGRRITDFNTTSISMLHQNLQGIWTAANLGGGQAQKWPYVMTYSEGLINNKEGDIVSNFLNKHQFGGPYSFHTTQFFYPNNLLTSYGFFSRLNELAPFARGTKDAGAILHFFKFRIMGPKGIAIRTYCPNYRTTFRFG
ncbi:MAG: hypothetical protein HYZ15_04620 [Sphingobacteriales bacterium]|nr:hypothetical protein [Sphingobacteriales bacterium]